MMNMTAPVRGALYMEAVSDTARPAANALLLVGWNLIWAGSAAIGGELADRALLGQAAAGTAASTSSRTPCCGSRCGIISGQREYPQFGEGVDRLPPNLRS